MDAKRLGAYATVMALFLLAGCARYRYALQPEAGAPPQVEVRVAAVTATRSGVTLDLVVRNEGPGVVSVDPAKFLIVTGEGEAISPRPPYERLYRSRTFGGSIFYGYGTEDFLFAPGVTYWTEAPGAADYLQPGDVPAKAFRRGKVAFYWDRPPETFSLLCREIAGIDYVPELRFRRIEK